MRRHLIPSSFTSVEDLMGLIRAPTLSASGDAIRAKSLIPDRFPRAQLFLAYEFYWGNTFAFRDTQKAMNRE